jgi:hypothetical protein
MADILFNQRLNQPPAKDDPGQSMWERDVAASINALPPTSAFSFDDPNSNVTAQEGTIGVNLNPDAIGLWFKQSGNTNIGWQKSQFYTTQTVTTTYAISAIGVDHTILCDATSAAFTVSLPATPTPTGRQYQIKKIDSTANAVTLSGNGNTIDDLASFTLQTQYEAVTVQWDGTEWWVV